eukprot:TRINITY_DN65026_c0_g1_i1.p1 TRINITY_DN65026_c0_g1~~TRINITY_DN65026_c0_g1_i1.p1  ORF type:complete len:391 (-),score=15.79 TRINITY_DN65026_c0_g1_i1:513-1685(-)
MCQMRRCPHSRSCRFSCVLGALVVCWIGRQTCHAPSLRGPAPPRRLRRIALIIDGDAFDPSHVSDVHAALKSFGEVRWQRSYMSEREGRYVRQNPSAAGKSLVDAQMIADVMELKTAALSNRSNVDAFAIVSPDGDFRGLAETMLGSTPFPVICMWPSSPGNISIDLNDAFTKMEKLGRKAASSQVELDGTEASILNRLTELGYVTPQLLKGPGGPDQSVPVDALEMFCYVHQMQWPTAAWRSWTSDLLQIANWRLQSRLRCTPLPRNLVHLVSVKTTQSGNFARINRFKRPLIMHTDRFGPEETVAKLLQFLGWPSVDSRVDRAVMEEFIAGQTFATHSQLSKTALLSALTDCSLDRQVQSIRGFLESNSYAGCWARADRKGFAAPSVL